MEFWDSLLLWFALNVIAAVIFFKTFPSKNVIVKLVTTWVFVGLVAFLTGVYLFDNLFY
jgi:hypothetical protein